MRVFPNRKPWIAVDIKVRNRAAALKSGNAKEYKHAPYEVHQGRQEGKHTETWKFLWEKEHADHVAWYPGNNQLQLQLDPGFRITGGEAGKKGLYCVTF